MTALTFGSIIDSTPTTCCSLGTRTTTRRPFSRIHSPRSMASRLAASATRFFLAPLARSRRRLRSTSTMCFLRVWCSKPRAGYPASTSRNKYLVKPTYLSAEMSSFAQYDWRARPWLTLNLGLRYDYFSQLSETNNQISNVDLAAARIIVAGSDTSSTAGLAED